MSTQTRSGDGGGRIKSKKVTVVETNKKADKTEKEKSHSKTPTAEQIRIAQIVEIKSESDDPKMREKVASLMEMTQRSEEEVCCALYECDNDMDMAVIFLLETLPVGAFETSSKKKKNRLTSVSNDATGDGEWIENSNSNTSSNQNNNTDARERSRSRGGMRGGRGGSDSRGWRGREFRENDRNASDSKDNWRGGRGGGRGGRGGYVSRGGRGGRMGPRATIGTREHTRTGPRQPQQNHQEVDSWDSTQVTTEINTWGDWDNEEYTGSLADTKVFTPSVSQSQSNNPELSAPPGLEQQVLNPPSHPDDLVQQYNTTVVSSTTTAAAVAASNAVQFPEIQTSNAHLRQSLELTPSASLSAEQSQYFNSLTSQNTGQAVSNVNSYQVNSTSVQYPATYGVNNSYVEQVGSAQPPSRKPRARVPPPSKIPATAVEMPGDTLNNIGYLDVQFGGLDFTGNEESFDGLPEKFNTANIDTSQPLPTPEVTSALAAGLQSSQITENLSSSYSQRSTNNVQQQPSSVNSVVNSMNNSGSGLDQLTKNDHYNQPNSSNVTGYQSVSYANNTSSKSVNYQPSVNPQGYNNSNYVNTQVSTNSNYPQSSSTYSAYNPTSVVNSYPQQNNSSNNSTVVNNSNNSVTGVTSNNASQNIPVNNNNAVNSSSNSNTGYLSSQYPTVSQTASAFPSQQAYQNNNQSVYGNSAGLSNNNTGYTGNTNTSSGQYGNFSSTKLKDTTSPVLSVSSSVVASSSPSSVTNSAVTTSSMSSTSLVGLTNTKVTNSTGKGHKDYAINTDKREISQPLAKSSGVVTSIPMVNQYIQTGMPFYQQPVYSYEDIQMMQQRMPHVPGYYDMNYQTPTSLGAGGVRDANLGSVAAYSTISDGRYARTDNNSSPVSNVPSTMSQQTGSGGPMLNLPYAYFYGGNVMPGGFQYGTPAIYPQQMATANATSGGQFPKPSYNSGYGSTGYDTLTQTAQDYSKGAYPGSGVGQQSKGQTVSNPQPAGTGSDITSSMYGKNHAALNKVNNYEKQSFHSGTPPPFNLAGTQAAGATSAQAYGAQHLYIPTMTAPHHNMNMHQPMHQIDSRIHVPRHDSNSGQRQQSSSQGKTTKQGYSPSYWAAQN